MLKRLSLGMILALGLSGAAFAAPCAGPAPSGGDDTSAINSALSACAGPVVLQAGTYNVSGTLNLRAVNNAGLIGMGQGTCGASGALGTRIKSTITTGTVVQGASSVTGQTIKGLDITRSSTGTSGSRGLDSGTNQTGALIADICSSKSYLGCYFHDANNTSKIQFVQCNSNAGDGGWFTAPGTTLAWNTQAILAEANGGTGWTINPAYGGGSSGAFGGTLNGWSTCCNTGYGVWMSNVSSATFIGSFIGDDAGAVEVYINNSSPTFVGSYVEMAGPSYGFYTTGSGTTTCYNCAVGGDGSGSYTHYLAASNFNLFGGGSHNTVISLGLAAGNLYARASLMRVPPTLAGTGLGLVVSSYWGAYSCTSGSGCAAWGNF